MRTTVDIDDDVLFASKQIARERGLSLGQVLSNLARESLIATRALATRNGVPLLPVREGGRVVTMELVNALRDEEP